MFLKKKEVYGFTLKDQTIYLLQPYDPKNLDYKCVSYIEQLDVYNPRNKKKNEITFPL